MGPRMRNVLVGRRRFGLAPLRRSRPRARIATPIGGDRPQLGLAGDLTSDGSDRSIGQASSHLPSGSASGPSTLTFCGPVPTRTTKNSAGSPGAVISRCTIRAGLKMKSPATAVT